jgi:hypothetical protein
MEILLRYNNDDKKELLISSSPENTFNELLKYLTKIGIAYVESVPEKEGIYCVSDKDTESYRVYQSVFNKEDQRYEAYFVYSLQWLSYYDKKEDIDKSIIIDSSTETAESIPV